MKATSPQYAYLLIATALALGSTSPALANHSIQQQIDGPSTMLEGTPFKLCAPWGKSGAFLWRGPGISGDSTASCVQISGLTPGTYVFTLRVDSRKGRRDWSRDTDILTQQVTVITEEQACGITGPDRVEPCSEVELCAPDFDGVRYSWKGSGISERDGHRRCVTARGLEPGTYTFELRIDGMGEPVRCEHTVEVGATEACLISGPLRVARDQSFELCGPDGDGWTWLWEGKRIPEGTSSRCVTVPGLSPGHYEYTLQLDRGGEVEICSQDVVVVDSSATCFVSGPSSVFAGETFELCGPPEDGHTYAWHGKGIPAGTTSRCVTIAGLNPGLHMYELKLTSASGTEFCSFAVQVADSSALTLCPQPLGFWRQDCGRFTQSGFLSPEDMGRIASCVDDRSALLDWPDDVVGFDSVLDGKVGKGTNRLLLQQYTVLLANLCAGDLGLLNATRDSVGIRLGTVVECGDSPTSVRDLITSVEALISAGRSGRWCPDRDVLHALACLDRINAARGEEFACWNGRRLDRGGFGRGGFGPHGVESATAADVGLAAPTVQFKQPSPNPFSTQTHVQYVAPVGGADVQLAVYDLAGRTVLRLAAGHWESGIHDVSWNGTDSSGNPVRPGMYFLRGRVGDQATAWRLLYVR